MSQMLCYEYVLNKNLTIVRHICILQSVSSASLKGHLS